MRAYVAKGSVFAKLRRGATIDGGMLVLNWRVRRLRGVRLTMLALESFGVFGFVSWLAELVGV